MNILKESYQEFVSFFKDFSSLKGCFSVAIISLFFSYIITDPIFYKIFFPYVNAISFIKQNSFILNFVSLLGQFAFIFCLFYYFYHFYQDRTLNENVKIFVSSIILFNISFILFMLIPVFIGVVLAFVGINEKISMILGGSLFLMFFFVYLYVSPYLLSKVLSIPKFSLREHFSIFFSIFIPNTIFATLKNKEYFLLLLRVSLVLGIVLLILLGIEFFVIHEMITTTKEDFFKLFYLLSVFLNSLLIFLTSFSMFFIAIRISDYIKNERNKNELLFS